jgi:hypothetical protein
VFDTAGGIGHFDMDLSPSGRSFTLVETGPGTVGGGIDSRVAR